VTPVLKIVVLNDGDFMETILMYQYKIKQTRDARRELAQSVQVLQVLYSYKYLKYLTFFRFLKSGR
jgi:hypothetical protein